MSTGKLARRYAPVRPLGEGAMGQVWLVDDTVTGKEVALKVISERFGSTQQALLQFKQEFRLMTQLRHPNCCAVYDYGQMPDGAPYFTMEYVPGFGLDEILPLSEAQTRSVLVQLLQALGYIHQQGLVHRDLKSANVRLRPDGVVKLMDYGLMAFTGQGGHAIAGTVAYMSPEMVKRTAIDQRADLYALGALAYELLTGQPPFVRPTPIEVLRAHATDAPVPPRRLKPAIDPTLERIVLKLLAKDPIERYPSAYDVLAELGVERIEGGEGQLLSSPLIGRADELAALNRHLGTVGEGRPGGAVVLHGPLGIGKSRIVEELRFQVQLAGLPLAIAVNHEFSHSPYGPFGTILRSLLPALKLHADEVLERHKPVLVKLLPELDAVPAEELDPPGKEKMRFQGAIADVLAALSDRQGVVLVLEDWQWTDPLSAELMAYLMRALADKPILFVLTMRQWPDPAPEWLIGAASIPLGNLDGAGLHRMVGSMLGSAEVAPAFLARVAELSGGNPYFVEMMLEYLVVRGILKPVGGRWNTEAAFTAAQLPGDLRALVMDKLHRIPAPAHALARAAAVIGYHFPIDLLKQVAGLEDDALFEAIRQLIQHQIFEAQEDGAYAFAQDQLQDVLYNDLSGEERLKLHTAVGVALEARLAGSSLSEVVLEVITQTADQFIRSARPDRAIPYCREAGLRNARLQAYQDALVYLEAGLRMIRMQPEGQAWREAKLDLLRVIGDVRRVLGHFEAAQAAYTEAIPLAEAMGDRLTMARMLTSLAKVHQFRSSLDEGLAACAQALTLARAVGDEGEAWRGLMTSARIHYFRGALQDAVAHAEEGLAAARASRDPGKVGMALSFIGYLYVSAVPGRTSQGVDCLNEAIALHTEMGDKIGLQNALDFLGNAQTMLGDFKGARTQFLHKQTLCRELGYRDEEAIAFVNLALVALELGALGEALAHAKEARALASRMNSKYPLAMALAMESLAALHLGDLSRPLALAEEALALVRALQNKYLEAQVLGTYAAVQVALGRFNEAQTTIDQWRALNAGSGSAEPDRRLEVLQAEILLRQHALEEARQLVEATIEAARQAEARAQLAQGLRVAARVAMRQANWKEARTRAEEGLAIAAELGCRHLEATLHGLLGEIALSSGRGPSGEHFKAMAAAAAETGDRLLQAEALFGLAASQPYVPEAKTLAGQAHAALAELLGQLDSDAKALFVNGYEERTRILEGNYIGFSLPIAGGRRATTGQLNPNAMRFNKNF